MALSVQEFWQLVVASGLHDEARCRQLADAFAQARETGAIARTLSLPEWMLKTGGMTRYQAKILLAGTPGPFSYGDYVVEDRRTIAGLGQFYRAAHRPTGVAVWLQFLSGSHAADRTVLRALESLTASGAAISRATPYLVHCHQLVDQDAFKFFVCEDFATETLADRLARGPLPTREAARVLCQVTQGLVALHSAQQVHGAVRPDRVLLGPAGAQLTGFPLARDPLALLGIDVSLGVDAAAVDYCAPELTKEGNATAAGDIYSLGCMVYQMLAGRVPFPHPDPQQRLELHRTGVPTPLDQVNPAIPSPLATLVGRMLSKAPEARYADALQLAATTASLAKACGVVTENAVAPAARRTLDDWLEAHGELPLPPVAGAQPAAQIALTADEFAPASPPVIKRAPRRNPRLLMIAGGAIGVVAIFAVATLWVTSGTSSPRSVIATSSAPIQASENVTVIAPEVPAVAAQPEAPGDQREVVASSKSSESTPRPAEEIAGLDAPMWTSPTSGPPLELTYLPAGCEIIVALRPASWSTKPEIEKLLDTRVSNLLGSYLTEALPKRLGVPLEKIDQLLIGLLTSTEGEPRVALVAHAAAELDTAEILRAWGNPDPQEKEGQTYYQQDGMALHLPAAAAGKTLVVGPTELIVDDVLPDAGTPPALGREMEALVAASDADRDATVLMAPSILATGGKEWWPGSSARLRAPLQWMLSGQERAAAISADADLPGVGSVDLSSQGLPRAILASAHLSEANLFLEVRIPTEPDRPAAVLAPEYKDRLARLPKRVSEYVRTLELGTYSRDVLFDFPMMTEQLERYTVVGTSGRQVVLRAYLPNVAAHNLALGTNLALNEQLRTPDPAGTRQPAGQPAAGQESLAKRLDRKISLVFDRATLEKSLQLLGDELAAQVVILGPDLQAEGITKNQSFGLSERDQPAREILQKVMMRANPDGKLIYVIKSPPGATEEALYITTRAAAERRGDPIPAEFAATP